MSFSTRPIGSSRRRTNDTDAVGAPLRAIYGDSEGRIRDMSRFEHRSRRRTRFVFTLFLILFTFVAGAGVAGFFLLRTQDRFSGEGVKVKVTAPEQVTSGEIVHYSIRYTNSEPVVLGNVELTVRYPRGFTLTEAHPEPSNKTGSGGTWFVGTLPRGREGTIELTGTLVGALNTQANLQALLTYKPANFNAEFQEVGSTTTTIASSILGVRLQGAGRVLPDTETLYTIAYENAADTAIAPVEVRVKFPSDFTITGTKPDRTGIATQWSFDAIEKKKKGTIEIRGKFAKDASGERTVGASIGIGKGEAFSLQKEDVFTTNIVKGDLLISLVLNGSSAASSVNFSDALQYTMGIKNNSDTPMENVTARLLVASPVVDWATLDDKARGVRDGSTITWTRSNIRDLRLLDPGEEVLITMGLRVKRTKEGLNFEDLVIESRAEVTVAQAGKLPVPIVVNSNTIITQINSDVTIENEARYFAEDGTKIGDGPLPPRVEQTTMYRVIWTVTNSLHELLSMKASTVLPLDVSFGAIGRVSQGTLLYNPDTREVYWTLQRLQTTIPKATIEFTVVVTPTKEAVGKILPLTGDVTLQARDKATGALLTLKKSGANTALDDDEFGRGKGVVGE